MQAIAKKSIKQIKNKLNFIFLNTCRCYFNLRSRNLEKVINMSEKLLNISSLLQSIECSLWRVLGVFVLSPKSEKK